MTDQIYQHEELDEFGELVSLDQHFKLLTRFFCCYTPHPEDIEYLEWDSYRAEDYWNGVSNCFFVAASIDRVETYPGVIDNAGSWCSSAAEYDDRKGDFIAQYVKEATRYMWLWIAFEEISKKLCPNNNLEHRTSRVANYLRNANWVEPGEIKRFCELFVKEGPPSVIKTAMEKAIKSQEHSFLFIHLCREMRNHMTHCSIANIEPDEDHDENDERVAQLKITSRLGLLMIQEILVTYLRQSPAITEENEDGEFTFNEILSGVKLWQAAKVLHLKDPSIVLCRNQTDWVTDLEDLQGHASV